MATEAPPTRSAPAEPYDTDALAASMEEIMKQTGVEPDTTPAAAETIIEPEIPEEPAAPTAEEPEIPEGEPVATEPETTDQEEMLKIQQAEEATAAIAEAAKKAAAPVAPVKPVVNERDKDLVVPPESAAHLHPKTRQLIKARNELVVAAREERDKIAAERTELQTKLAAAEEQAKKITVPKDVETELATLRERVRELDITRDPAIETKYDAPVKANNATIVETLKQFGLGKRVEGDKVVDAPEQIEALVKSGLNFRTLKPLIDTLEKMPDGAGIEAAENIREALRHNNRLVADKQSEITSWKANYDAKRQNLTHAQQQQQEQLQTTLRSTAAQVYDSEIAELAKTIPFLAKPAPAAPNDSPAIVAQKLKAQADFDAVTAKVQESVKDFVTDGKSPEETVKAQGRLMASAVQGIRFKLDVLPRMVTQLSAANARIAELEKKLNTNRAAQTVSRTHAASVSTTAGSEKALPANTLDAAAQIAREMGLPV